MVDSIKAFLSKYYFEFFRFIVFDFVYISYLLKKQENKEEKSFFLKELKQNKTMMELCRALENILLLSSSITTTNVPSEIPSELWSTRPCRQKTPMCSS